jgi:hypothetical protein
MLALVALLLVLVIVAILARREGSVRPQPSTGWPIERNAPAHEAAEPSPGPSRMPTKRRWRRPPRRAGL